MMQTVNEEVVKGILRNKEKKIENIHKKMLALYRELEEMEDMRAREFFRRSGWMECRAPKTGGRIWGMYS